MKPISKQVCFLGLLGALAGLAAAQTPAPPAPTSPGRQDLSAFQLVSDRNIFNANRSRRSGRSGADDDDAKPSRVETLTLVGTLSYDKGPYAFFDGSSAAYRQVLEAGKSIADYKITAVTNRGVILESGTNTVELAVGMQLRREDQGQWRVVPSTSSVAALSGSGTGTDTAKGAADSSDESDIVKRLMQQREQELK